MYDTLTVRGSPGEAPAPVMVVLTEELAAQAYQVIAAVVGDNTCNFTSSYPLSGTEKTIPARAPSRLALVITALS